MPKMNETTLNAKIKAGELSGLYLLYGEEPVMVDGYVKKIVKMRGEEAIERFGRDTPLEEVLEAVETPSFFGNKCVLVNDYPLWTLDADGLKHLEATLSDGFDCLLVFWYSAASFDVKSAKGKKALALLESAGQTVCFTKLDNIALARMLSAVATKGKCGLDATAARYLVDTCGSELALLKNELYKLMAYAGEGGSITIETIDRLATQTISVSVFNLVRAILYQKSDEVFRIVDGLFQEREQPIAIVGAVSSAYMDIFRTQLAADAHKPLTAAAADFGYKGSPFRLRKADELKRRLSASALRRSINLIAECDLGLKSGTGTPRYIVERLMVELIGQVSAR